MSIKAICGMPRKRLSAAVLAMTLCLLSSVAAWAQLTMHDVQTTDVTPSGFSVVWRTSEAATPRIAIFEDMAGTIEVTSDLEVSLFPLAGGDPELTDEFSRDEAMDALRDTAKGLGMMKLRVQGCSPESTYYFNVSSDNGSEVVSWPETGLVSVTTTKENALVYDSRQILLNLADNLGTVDFQGWLVTVFSDKTLYPLSSYVGDGAGVNQAYLDLNNLFDGDQDNWTPAGLQVVTLAVQVPGADSVQRRKTIIYSDPFRVSSVITVDINLNEAGDADPPIVTPSPPGGAYLGAQNITLSFNEPCYIFFTTDNSEPTTSSSVYTTSIVINQTTTLKFMAVDIAGNQSDVRTEDYTIVYNNPPYVPHGPDPADGLSAVSTESELSWQSDGDPDGGDVVTYDVHLWTDTNTDPPVCPDLSTLTCQPGALLFNQTYFWQVTAKDNRGGEASGPLWSFTTFAPDGDEDGDGVSNADEIFWMTNPYEWDTDKDGYSDYDEIGFGSDPLDKTNRPTLPPNFGDINRDQAIDGIDLALLSAVFGSKTGEEDYLEDADFNGDGEINAADLELFPRVFGLAFVLGYDAAADFDRDGDVDGFDFAALLPVFGLRDTDGGFDPTYDLNPDGVINEWDLAIFAMALGSVSL